MAIKLKVGESLPLHASYKDDHLARDFWRLTFKTGRHYISGLDAMGGKILIPHERETEGYTRRLRMTKPRNHSGPIIRRYNNHVFRVEAKRSDDASTIYQELLADIDGHGANINTFMKKALEKAQVERESYIMVDSTNDMDGEMTQAQADDAGVRAVFKLICADSVLNWTEYDDALTELLVIMCREDGTKFARLYNDETYQEAEIKDENNTLTVLSVGAEVAHGYSALPIVRMRPFEDESQISPLAEVQQCITNLMSWNMEEAGNITFSQMVASGVAASDIGEMKIGNNRLICLPNPAAKVDMIGADPAQGERLSSMIKDEERELYRVAGIQADDPTSGRAVPESGIAKAFKHNDLSANLSSLAGCVEDAENQAMKILFDAIGEPYPGDVKFPDDFDLPNIADDLAEVISAVTVTALPKTIKNKITADFAQRHLSLTPEEEKTMQSEMLTSFNDPLTNQPSGMQGT